MRSFLFYSFILLLFISCGNERLAPPPLERKPGKASPSLIRQDVVLLRELRRPGGTAFESLTGVVGDSLITSTFKGKIYSGDTMWPKRTLLVDLKSEYMLDKLYFHPLENNEYLVVWQETTHEGTRSSIARFGKNLQKPEWINTYRLPEPGQPLLDGDNCFYSFRGRVGCVDVNTGKESWTIDSLFTDRIRFGAFHPPHLYADSIAFVERLPVAANRKADSVVVKLSSGKRIH